MRLAISARAGANRRLFYPPCLLLHPLQILSLRACARQCSHHCCESPAVGQQLRKRRWKARNRKMEDFPAIPAPASTQRIDIEQFLLLLHGKPGSGLPPLQHDADSEAITASSDLAAVQPQILAIDVRSPAEYRKGEKDITYDSCNFFYFSRL
eukprot:SAG31_NODE_6442_length_2016_cov_6.350548_1_plen_153_part_00